MLLGMEFQKISFWFGVSEGRESVAVAMMITFSKVPHDRRSLSLLSIHSASNGLLISRQLNFG